MITSPHVYPAALKPGKMLQTEGRCITLACNNTRQGYARKRTLKLAGYFFPGTKTLAFALISAESKA